MPSRYGTFSSKRKINYLLHIKNLKPCIPIQSENWQDIDTTETKSQKSNNKLRIQGFDFVQLVKRKKHILHHSC